MKRLRRRHTLWGYYRRRGRLGWSRWYAIKRTFRFGSKLVALDMRHWWWRLFAPLDVSGIYMGYRPRGSLLILDNLGVEINWKAMEVAAKEKAARERGDTICKAHSFPACD